MLKSIKYSLVAAGVLVGVLVLALGAFISTFDANLYKGQIVAQVESATGRKLEISGDLGLELFPVLAITVDGIALGNPTGFGAEPPLLRVAHASASVKLWPLLSRRVEVGRVRIEGLQLALARQADGKDNWSGMGGEEAAAAPSGDAPLSFSLEGVTIGAAALTFSDAQAGRRIELKGLELESGPVARGQPLALQGRAELVSSAPALQAKLGFRARLAATLDAVEDLALQLDAEGEVLPAPIVGGEVGIAKLTLGEPLKVEGFTFAAWGLKLAGGFALAGERLEGRLDSEQFAPRPLLAKLGIEVPVTADPKALSSAKLGFGFVQQGDSLALEPFALSVDSTDIAGRVALASIEREALRFDLSLDAIDLDRYLAPDDGQATEAGGLEGVELPTAAIRDLDLVGTFKAAKLSVAKVQMSALRVGVKVQGGVLRIDPFSAKLYGGTLEASARMVASQVDPELALEADLAGFKIGDFMQDAFTKVHATGVATLKLDLVGAGATLGDVKRDLDGTVRFDVAQGTLESFNVWKEARLAWAKYKKRTTTAAGDPDRTEFEALRGGADVKDGMVTLVGVTAAIPFAAVTAKGAIDLKAKTLDVAAQAKITGAPVFGPKEDFSDLKGITLPLDIEGPYVDPKVSVDVLKAAASALKPENLLKDEKIKKKLKSIFG